MYSFALVALLAASASAQYGGYGGYGSYGGYGYTPTYSYRENVGHGIFDEPNEPKPLTANDGYTVKIRDEGVHDTVNAKCVLTDPEEESPVSGLVQLSQSAYETGTNIYA